MGSFHHLKIVKNTALHIGCSSVCLCLCFVSFWEYTQRWNCWIWILGQFYMSILGTNYIVFCCGCIILHHHQQCMRVLVSPHQHLFSVLGFCFFNLLFYLFVFGSIGSLLLPGFSLVAAVGAALWLWFGGFSLQRLLLLGGTGSGCAASVVAAPGYRLRAQ